MPTELPPRRPKEDHWLVKGLEAVGVAAFMAFNCHFTIYNTYNLAVYVMKHLP